jgi:hypothetical protein
MAGFHRRSASAVILVSITLCIVSFSHKPAARAQYELTTMTSAANVADDRGPETSVNDKIIFQSSVTCPLCGHMETETMPDDACQWFYECKGCGTLLKPKQGDCCVFCSYGSVPCPPMQQNPGGCRT